MKFFFVSCFFIASNIFSQPYHIKKYEAKAVWITTAYGIDWPYKNTNPEKQKIELENIFKDLYQKKINMVFFQVRVRGDVLFPSIYEPFHEYLTGTFGKTPSYDVVQFALSLARKYGIEFHAWFNTMILRGRKKTPISVGVKTIWDEHPEWIDKRAIENSNQEDAYLNPAIPEVRQHLINVILDFVKRYDVDGIQLDDYLRYPSKDFPDDVEYEKFNPRKLSRADWRRENINMVVENLYDELMKEKSYLRFGVTPIGVYKRQDSEPAMESVSEVYQDSREWLKRGKCDYLAPQVYFHIGKTTPEEKAKGKYNPAFEKLVEDWGKNKFDRQIFIGLGLYKPTIKKEYREQIELCRKFQADGIAFYPYNQTKDIVELFRERTLVPPMYWKKTKTPNSPSNIKVKYQDNQFIITWNKEVNVHWVNVYVSSISMINPTYQNVYENKIHLNVEQFTGDEKIFLTSIDRYGNESEFSNEIVIGERIKR